MIQDVVRSNPVEARPHHSDSTSAEIEAIKNRVFVLDERIVYLKQLKVVSSYSINLVIDQVLELGRQFDSYCLIIDVTDTKRPDAMTRRTINQRFAEFCNEGILHVAFYTGRNIFLNTTIHFVVFGTNLRSFSANRTLEKTLEKVRNVIDENR